MDLYSGYIICCLGVQRNLHKVEPSHFGAECCFEGRYRDSLSAVVVREHERWRTHQIGFKDGLACPPDVLVTRCRATIWLSYAA